MMKVPTECFGCKHFSYKVSPMESQDSNKEGCCGIWLATGSCDDYEEYEYSGLSTAIYLVVKEYRKISLDTSRKTLEIYPNLIECMANIFTAVKYLGDDGQEYLTECLAKACALFLYWEDMFKDFIENVQKYKPLETQPSREDCSFRAVLALAEVLGEMFFDDGIAEVVKLAC